MKKTPLDSIDTYLWNKLQGFPHYDGLSTHPPKTPMHVYYEQGWELINHLKMLLFSASSSSGNRWPFAVNGELGKQRLFNIRCKTDGCEEWAECLINQIKGDKRIDRYGEVEYDWVTLADAPVFLCFPHYFEVTEGKKYVPPTKEESMRFAAQWRAMQRMSKERPPQSLDLDNGLHVHSHIYMDADYLRRLAELMEEEYQALIKEEGMVQ